MKKFFYASLLAVSVCSFSACNNGDYDANPKVDNSGTSNPLSIPGDCDRVNKTPISATVNNEVYVAEDNFFTAAQEANLNGTTFLQVQGYKDNFQGEQTVVELLVSNYTGAKTYSLGASEAVGSVSQATNPSAQFTTAQGGSGRLIITRDDADTVAGTFYFTGKNSAGQSKTACGGYFKMKKS